MSVDKTFIMIKPDGVERNLIGKIISRLELAGFCLLDAKRITLTLDLVQEHYNEHQGKDFYNELCSEMVGDGKQSVVAMIWSGSDIIQKSRQLIGATNPENAEPGTIRREFGISRRQNTIHGSDSKEAAAREIALWFNSK